ncbi:MAG: indolepyruvate oxidoreductase subunit beta, partial [Christensenellaceae bacterium]|nr:indolepyruvate oxidoreductase subunit beta [Christensenellaceae bacterium]
VGGQGTLLASVLLGNLAMKKGYDVKLSEVHGMAQRGGSVVTHVRMSEGEVTAPVIDEGGADVIVAFEMLEAYRWVSYLKPGGKMYVNTQVINPMPVIMGVAEYPADIEGFLYEKVGKENVTFLDALAIAEAAGSVKAVNTVLLGALAKELPFTKEMWLEEIASTVKPRFVELNKVAFSQGYEK